MEIIDSMANQLGFPLQKPRGKVLGKLY